MLRNKRVVLQELVITDRKNRKENRATTEEDPHPPTKVRMRRRRLMSAKMKRNPKTMDNVPPSLSLALRIIDYQDKISCKRWLKLVCAL
jgi:hypothetical protein